MRKFISSVRKYYLFSFIILSCLQVGNLEEASAKTSLEVASIEQLPVLSPDPIHEAVARRVTNFFTQSHYHDFSLNGVFSSKVFDRYLKLLDGNKLVFIRKDIDQFRNRQTQIGEQLASGDVHTAYDIYNLFLKKRFKRYQYALSLLGKPLDFSSHDEIDLKRDDIAWSESEAELDKFWQKRVKYDQLSLLLSGKKEKEIKETLTKRYERILRILTQTKSEDAFQVFMNAFAREIDPHTSYLAPRIKKNFDSEMSLTFEGIGATLTQDDDYTSIVSFINGGPAIKTKQLVVGDRIIGVGQEGKTIEDVIGWRLDDVVDKIRGPKGTKVRLEILPAGNSSTPKIVDIVRDKIHFEDREAKLTIKVTEKGKVAIIDIPGFYIGLTEKVEELLKKVNSSKVNGVLIDLRNNGGGSLAEVITLTRLFTTEGPVVQVRDNLLRVMVYEDKNEHTINYLGPVVVLVNRYSASASEIFSAALQDYGRAVIVGETTYGKGTVQTSRSINYPFDSKLHPNWPELGGVQYTVQKFYRINGGSTQLKGVIPDIEMTEQQYIDETGERFLDNALSWDKIPAAKYDPIFDMKKVIPNLTSKHLERIKTDPEFIYIHSDIIRFNEKSERQYIVSLNRDIREAEQANNKARELKQMNERLVRAGLNEVSSLDDVPKDFKVPDAYLDEAVQILLDLSQYYPKNVE